MSQFSSAKEMDENLWDKGPDALIDSDIVVASKLNQAVKLRSKEIDLKKYPPISVYSMFKKSVNAKPEHHALAYKQDNNWLYFTYEEYWKMCVKASKSFIKLGLKASECVAILGFNAPQWFISNLGTMFAGGVGCGIYTTNSAESCEYILNDSKAGIVVVENKQHLEKILECRKSCSIRAIIQYSGNVEDNHDGLVMSWKEFIDFGLDVSDEIFERRVKTIAPNKCACLIYTSGTTGVSKAAMISHDSITYLVRHIGIDQARLRSFEERFVSYLPLSHIAAQAVDIYCSLYIGATVYFAQPDALRGSLAQTLQEVRPTYFFGVPRVWEKMQEKIESKIKKLSGTKLKLLEWSRRVARDHIHSLFIGENKHDAMYRLVKFLVLNKIHQQMGLDQCSSTYSAAAPITKDTLDFFISIGIPLCEVYGMSESCGPHSLGTIYSNRVTSVGPVNQYNRSKVHNKDEDGSGELCVFGRHIFMGYLNDEEKTIQSLDPDGWLHTGDIAKINDGFIYITGRLKEILITAGGENIAPVPIEDNIKSGLPNLISNCMLIGDKRKFLVVLITLKCKMNYDTNEPTNQLTDECVEWLRSKGLNVSTIDEIINKKDSIVYSEIEKTIKNANEKSQCRAAKVQKFTILPRDFSIANGELGPTLKLRRPIVNKMYATEIDKLYEDKKADD